MNHRLRTLGLAFAACAAFTALSAQVAQASEFVSRAGAIHVLSTTEWTTRPGSTTMITAGGQTLECHGTFHSENVATVTEIKGEPKYIHPETEASKTYCTPTESNLKVPIKSNGCSYTLHAGPTVAPGEYEGTTDVSCPEGKAIEIEVKGLFEEVKCRIRVPAQKGLEHVVYENTEDANGHQVIAAGFALKGIRYTTEGGLLGCGVANGEYSNGAYEDEMTAQAFNEKGEQIEFELIGE